MQKNSLTLGVDASNIRLGGGVTHLIELFSHFNLSHSSFEKIIVWGGQETLSAIPHFPWLIKFNPNFLNKNLFFRTFWQIFFLRAEFFRNKCSVLFVPGGVFFHGDIPAVVMSQNLLPFEPAEVRRYGVSLRRLKFILLKKIQISSFKKARGIIFLTEYAKNVVLNSFKEKINSYQIISHGIAEKFINNSGSFFLTNGELGKKIPLKIIYVSNIDFYKHQTEVLKGLHILRKEGYSIEITFIGPAIPVALDALTKVIIKYNAKEWAIYLGKVDYEKMASYYSQADIAIFASSCETFGIILLEKMASRLPVACSDRSSMPEILENGGIYFDPENPISIANAVRRYIVSPELRLEKQKICQFLIQEYSWKKCAEKTFSFLEQVSLLKI